MFEVVQIHQKCFTCGQPFRPGEGVKIWQRPWKFRYGKQEKKARRTVKHDMSDGFLVHAGCRD